jgi:hypothetical protein
MSDMQRCSVWVDTREAGPGIGWFRIADDVHPGVASEIVLALSVPAEILPAHATGAELARKLYPEVREAKPKYEQTYHSPNRPK